MDGRGFSVNSEAEGSLCKDYCFSEETVCACRGRLLQEGRSQGTFVESIIAVLQVSVEHRFERLTKGYQ